MKRYNVLDNNENLIASDLSETDAMEFIKDKRWALLEEIQPKPFDRLVETIKSSSATATEKLAIYNALADYIGSQF